jgi:hypothetical protein
MTFVAEGGTLVLPLLLLPQAMTVCPCPVEQQIRWEMTDMPSNPHLATTTVLILRLACMACC